ncbi:S1/P1 nuclease [Candidatus Neomarinimicrobiota bacterium]
MVGAKKLSLLCIVTFLFIESIAGWGYEGHRRINRLAAQLVAGEFGIFLATYQDSLAIHGPDPDYWKEANLDEGYRHYFDSDYYDKYPFDNIPRELDELINVYSDSSVKSWGIAPWAIKQKCEAVTELLRNGDWDNVILQMAALGHYVADIHMPLHTVANYNGQLSGNEGIHFRWEISMVNQLVNKINPVGPVEYIDDPVEYAFTIIKESFSNHENILSADSLARASLTDIQRDSLKTYETVSFEDEYLDILFNETKELAHQRLGMAAVRVASYWYTCWVNAGQPNLPD